MPDTKKDPRDILLALCGSLTLCDHMGDVGNDVDIALKELGLEFTWDDWHDLAHELHKLGVRTLSDTELVCEPCEVDDCRYDKDENESDESDEELSDA